MIPIFIIVKDRLTVLLRSIDSYLKLGSEVKIVLLDNGSTYTPLLEWEKTCGYEIIRNLNPEGTFTDISDWIGKTVDTYPGIFEYYIVTDPDIELEHPSPKLLETYVAIMKAHSGAVCVGPMLRIDDLPECFAFRDQMINSHMLQFWGPQHERRNFRDTLIQIAWIDTTFAMYRRGFRFQRLNKGLRVHEPYMAKHLDWYLDTLNLTDEQKYYFDHASNVSTMKVHIEKGGMY